MNKALQHLYKAVSGEDTRKVNISKLLVDIHKAVTGKDSANKNNWARIIDSMAENWSGGGGGGGVNTTTIEGTLQNPWDGRFADVYNALKNNLGSAVLNVTMGTQSATFPLMYSNHSVLVNGSAFTGMVTSFTSYIAMWSESGGGKLGKFLAVNGNSDNSWSATDYTSLATNFPTVLTLTLWGD